MKRVVLNVLGLAIFVGVIFGACFGLRGLGVGHSVAWILGFVIGSFVIASLKPPVFAPMAKRAILTGSPR